VFPDLLRARLPGIVDLSAGQLAALEAHYQLLLRWNRTLNLTRVDNLEEAVERHYSESLFLAAHLPSGSLRIADVGSGAGFPGFPVAIARPDCEVTLIESHQRKAVFLKEASRGFANLRVLSQRAESVKDTFDHVISRAVSYEDLATTLQRIAANVDLLTGAEPPSESMGVDWQPAISLPWGDQRFLRIGRVCAK
jgi:16S rRNA (guanine(527)-N(7))-methyltransferase RsmG